MRRSLRRSAFGRTLALLAGVAVLNMLVAPEASACDREAAPAPAMAAMDHGTMHDHHAAVAETTATSEAPAVSDVTDCQHMAGGCSTSCAPMVGCTTPAFTTPDVAVPALLHHQAMPSRTIAHAPDRDSAPDSPPPRA